MNDSYFQFASDLVDKLLVQEQSIAAHPQFAVKIQMLQEKNSVSMLDLTPFKAKPAEATAYTFFSNIQTAKELVDAYHNARKMHSFETDLTSVKERINSYADSFINKILASAENLTRQQIRLISQFVKNLDVYCATKSIESLLNSKADIALLEVAEQHAWNVHFDHLAIRCGSTKNNDAAFIADFLRDKHGYLPSQVKTEAHYQFPDGWNAFPLYKILDNGQVLRLFVDQSDMTDSKQIIQHWNRVYGYTAHHLAMRVTEISNGEKRAIPLDEVMNALQAHGVSIMQPTGEHTHGLLQQVFTKPELNETIPQNILDELRSKGNNLDKTIKNGKLLEVVSRKEMPVDMAFRLFALYGLEYNVYSPLHSAPIYTYFLPAQAAHVINTSQSIDQ